MPLLGVAPLPRARAAAPRSRLRNARGGLARATQAPPYPAPFAASESKARALAAQRAHASRHA